MACRLDKCVNYVGATTIEHLYNLYGINVRPVAPVGSASRKPYVDSALIHRILPDELLFEVFAQMTPYNLGRASCVCQKWRYTIRNPLTGLVKNYKLLQSKYEGSWRKMWLSRLRVRTDGLYVSRNTYIRVGVAKWKNLIYIFCTFYYLIFSTNYQGEKVVGEPSSKSYKVKRLFDSLVQIEQVKKYLEYFVCSF
ncbi:hypothetical protein UlMin_020237 [Ulmus minor]